MNDTYLRFVVERHRVWEQRQAGAPGPWTTDPVLAGRKFTNVFRILDPGTQFLMTDLFEPDLEPRDALMRAFLYRHTGRIETWQHVRADLGSYPTVDNLEDVRACWKDWGQAFFTSAYLVFPQSQVPGTNKIDSIVELAQRLFTTEDIMPDWVAARNQAERFAVLRRNKGVGDFMSMQILTDWGYRGDDDLEDDFVVPGPGCIKGAKVIYPDRPVMKTLRWAVDAVRELADCPRLGYRKPSIMDVQNTLCEFSKYHRYTNKPVPAPYQPSHPGQQPTPVLPTYYNEDLL